MAARFDGRGAAFIQVMTLRALLILATVAAVTGCATRHWNSPLPASPTDRYDFTGRLPRDNAQDIFIVLAFSGGGTRSAAFSYGILEALRDTEVVIHGNRRRLLDEVDVISATSGGSYTAAYYGLFGDRIFSEFEAKFLKRKVNGALIRLLLNPVNLTSIARPNYNRGDLAARWLARNVFENRTYADLSRDSLPFVIVNASDLNTGITFSFIQQQFDFLCSDINSFPVANAVMASSAIPALFGAIALRNFDNDCVQRADSWVSGAVEDGDLFSREYQVARGLDRYSSPEHFPVVRLMDGGITDNLGVRGSMMSPVAHYGNVADMAGAFSPEELEAVTDVLVVVANAQVYPDYDWSRSGREPDLAATFVASFDAALNILNTETVTLAERGFRAWADSINSQRPPASPEVNVRFATLTFQHIADSAERDYFNAVPLTLALPDEVVDRIRSVARSLLYESAEFQQFVGSFR